MEAFSVSGAVATWAIEKLCDTVFEAVVVKLRERKARAALEQIVADAVAAAIQVVPALENETIAQDFAEEIVSPILLATIADPTVPLDLAAVGAAFIARFVAPLQRGRVLDTTLIQSFQGSRAELATALDALQHALRSGLYASPYWRDSARDQALEEVRTAVRALASRLGVETGLDVFAGTALSGSTEQASQALMGWPRTIEGHAMPRPELDTLLIRIRAVPDGRTLVVGEAGSGKSALFAELAARLKADGVGFLAIKADLLPVAVTDLRSLARELGLRGSIESEIGKLLRAGPAVLLIDQLDAVSDVMDRKSERMRVLLELAALHRVAEGDGPPLHVLVSSRPFEAKHDARFRALDAETITLALPEPAQVNALLQALAIDPVQVPEALRGTLRRPFALKLYVDLVRRDQTIAGLTPAHLLAEWLRTATLGDDRERAATVALLERLAADMTETETLWRPADVYEADARDAVRRGEACGLIVRHGDLLGFSHQAWLDDFQAQGFSTGGDLAAFALARQDGLFARATVLRGLERLRRFDEAAYLAAVDALLGGDTTRRHLKHLVIDVIATQAVPLPRERAWVQRLVHEDVPLARRALIRIAGQWAGWAETIQPLMPDILAAQPLHWVGILLLRAIAVTDLEGALDLLDEYWPDAACDSAAFDFFSRSALWSPRVAQRLAIIFGRGGVQEFAISHYISELAKAGRHDAAAALLVMHLRCRPPPGRHGSVRYYGLEKHVDLAPQTFAEALLPWFVALALSDVTPNSSLREIYPRSSALPYDWNIGDEQGAAIPCLARALLKLAANAPEVLATLVTPYLGIEIDQVQSLIAEALAAAGAALAPLGVAFLLSDTRRLALGDAMVQDVRGVGHTIQGWSAFELTGAIAPFLPHADVVRLRDAIEAWDPYKPEAWEALTPKDRRTRLQWSEGMRFPLLERLPDSVIARRRRRQIEEWRKNQPKLQSGGRARLRMHGVGAPMSAEQMARAGDDELMHMLDAVADGTRRHSNRERWPFYGGAVELGQAFGTFGKAHPARAMALARTRLRSEVHESAAGHLVRELADVEAVSPRDVLDLIHALSGKGFVSEPFRRDSAWAMDSLAKRLKGLSDPDLALLESWIITDSETIFERIVRRLDWEARNRKTADTPDHQAQPALFGYGGGLTILPQDNFSLLSAIAAGALLRDPPAYDTWLDVLDRHADHGEDPQIGRPYWPIAGSACIGRTGRAPKRFLPSSSPAVRWRSTKPISGSTFGALAPCCRPPLKPACSNAGSRVPSRAIAKRRASTLRC
jgi:hypothetical protein